MATSTDKQRKVEELIAQLLAKAESTTPEEAEALTEHAERLMIKHMIDQSVIDARRAKAGNDSEKIITVVRDYRGNLAGENQHIGISVIRGMGTVKPMVSVSPKYFHLHVVGFESDVKQACLLMDSLEIQAVVAMRAWWKEHKEEHAWMTPYNQEKARRSFVHGFGTGAGARMKANRATIIEQAGTGTELVLVDRTKQVADAVAAMSTGKARGRSGGFAHANSQGYAAGQQANTGERGVGAGRKALGS